MFLAPEISWSREEINYMHAGRRNNLSFIRFEFSSFLCLWISLCSGTRVHHAPLERSREGTTCRTSSCSYKAPVFLPERSQSKVHLSSLPSESMLCACPVLVDPWRLSITQILWRWKYVEICSTWTSRWPGHADRWTARGVSTLVHFAHTYFRHPEVSHFAAFHGMWSLDWSKHG